MGVFCEFNLGFLFWYNRCNARYPIILDSVMMVPSCIENGRAEYIFSQYFKSE